MEAPMRWRVDWIWLVLNSPEVIEDTTSGQAQSHPNAIENLTQAKVESKINGQQETGHEIVPSLGISKEGVKDDSELVHFLHAGNTWADGM